MVKRCCHKCNTIFNRKSHYDYHISRKFGCVLKSHHSNQFNDEKNDNLNICENLPKFAKICENLPKKTNDEICAKMDLTNNKDFLIDTIKDSSNSNLNNSCSYCKKKFSTKYTLLRHINEVCKIKKESDEKEKEKENIFKLLLEKDKQKDNEIIELKKQNKILMSKIDNLINMKSISKSSKIINDNKNITNNLSNINNNYVIVNFGKENLDIINEKFFIDKIVKKMNISGVKIPDEVLKIIHFNPLYPQLSNIYISDINREKCMVYEDGEWKLSNIDNIPQVMDKICLFSKDQIEILREKYPNNKSLHDRLNTIEKWNNKIDDDYVQDLKDNDDYNNNKNLIKDAEDFKKYAYNTIKNTLYNEGKKLKKSIKNKIE